MKTLRSLILATAALALTAALSWAGDPNGSWKFKVETPNGRVMNATLTLKLDNGVLTGQMENQAGAVEIKDAKFADDQVTFTVTRKMRRREMTTHYSGKVEGDTIKGTIEASARGKEKTLPWEAQRVK